MGSHANGTIAYGIPLGNEETPPNMTDEEWEEAREEWDDDKIAERGWDIVFHGNSTAGYTDIFIVMPGTAINVYAWEPKRILPGDIAGPPVMDQMKFDHTAMKLGLDPKLAGWYVMVDFG